MSDVDPVALAFAALSRAVRAAGHTIALVEGDSAPWWSATFAGHAVWLTIEVAEGAPWLAALSDAELSIPGRFVADCAVERTSSGTPLVSLLILDPD